LYLLHQFHQTGEILWIGFIRVDNSLKVLILRPISAIEIHVDERKTLRIRKASCKVEMANVHFLSAKITPK